MVIRPAWSLVQYSYFRKYEKRTVGELWWTFKSDSTQSSANNFAATHNLPSAFNFNAVCEECVGMCLKSCEAKSNPLYSCATGWLRACVYGSLLWWGRGPHLKFISVLTEHQTKNSNSIHSQCQTIVLCLFLFLPFSQNTAAAPPSKPMRHKEKHPHLHWNLHTVV